MTRVHDDNFASPVAFFKQTTRCIKPPKLFKISIKVAVNLVS